MDVNGGVVNTRFEFAEASSGNSLWPVLYPLLSCVSVSVAHPSYNHCHQKHSHDDDDDTSTWATN